MITGVNMQHIPYKGGGPALMALIGGEAQLYFAIPITAIPHVKSGRLKALAIGSPARMRTLPQVPTFAEAGLPAFDIRIWFGLLAPPATPRPVTDRLTSDVARHLIAPDFSGRLSAEAMAVLSLNADAFAALLRADSAKYARVIKSANIRPD
jgi:tripartite-type tricarboxylate transporter receptor subunit TctC